MIVPTVLVHDGPAFAAWLSSKGYAPECREVTRSTLEGLTLLEVTVLLVTP